MGFELKSPAFESGGPIPPNHTCRGRDASVPLEWTDPPAGTKSFALTGDDPDAPGGTWVHWVLFDLPGEARSLPEGLAKTETLPDGSRQGVNDFKKIGYGGPCPPPGAPHRYFFTLYALDRKLGLSPGATKEALLSAMKGRILAEARWMGTFKR